MLSNLKTKLRSTRPIWLVSFLSILTSILIYLQIRVVTGISDATIVNEFLYIRRWTAVVDAFVLLGSFNIIIERTSLKRNDNGFASFCFSVFIAATAVLLVTYMMAAFILAPNTAVIIINNFGILIFITIGYSGYILNYTLFKIKGNVILPDFMQVIVLGLLPFLLLLILQDSASSGGFLAFISYLPIALAGFIMFIKHQIHFLNQPDLKKTLQILYSGIPRVLHFNFSNFAFFSIFSFIFSNESPSKTTFFGVFFIFIRLTETVFEGYSRSIISLLRQQKLPPQVIRNVPITLFGFSLFLSLVFLVFFPALVPYVFLTLFPAVSNYELLTQETNMLLILLPFYIFIILERPRFDPFEIWAPYIGFIISLVLVNYFLILPYIYNRGTGNYTLSVTFLFSTYMLLLLFRKKTEQPPDAN